MEGEQPKRITSDGSAYAGKRLLVGITYKDHKGELIRQEQFHGLILEAGEGGIVIERNDTGEQISLPPELKEAPPGNYRLRSTGEVVVDPDYLATWLIEEPAPEADGEAAEGLPDKYT
jgi:hypothetical protein